MIRLMSLLALCLALLVRRSIAETIAQSLPAAEACAQLNQRVMKQVAEGQMSDARSVVVAALERDSGPNACACAGVILSNMAFAMSVSGRREWLHSDLERGAMY
jgi:hypothetical protein